MLLKPAEIERFLARPDPAVRAVLLFGPDLGLARERAEQLTRLVAGSLDDPFRVVHLGKEALGADPARLHDEAAALSLMGGRRLLRLGGLELGKTETAIVSRYLATPPPGDALLVVEGGDLGREDGLRQMFETAASAVALPCYVDEGEALQRLIVRQLAERRVTAEADALAYLLSHLGGDRVLVRNEVDKLALYVGAGGRASLDDALALIGDAQEQDMQALGFAVADGAIESVDLGYRRCLQAGTSPVAVVRAVLRHFQRLHGFAVQLEPGGDPQGLFERVRPKPFWKHLPILRRQLRRWSAARLAEALDRLDLAEATCKQTDMPAEAVVGQTLLALALAAGRPPGS